MQIFSCATCRKPVFFENSLCTNCGSELAFDPRELNMVVTSAGSDAASSAGTGSPPPPLCANAAHAACNWLVTNDDTDGLCTACALNEMIPDLTNSDNLQAWREFEQAKKRLIYQLLRLHLPLGTETENGPELAISFKDNAMTGHDDGLITVSLDEADDVHRETQRQAFDEPYRTLLGHLRHESGHFYWDVLIDNGPLLARYRETFGDERADYQAALDAHHANGPPTDWSKQFVSAYASMHPWEDWAESWAHYLHIVDVIDTARAAAARPGKSIWSLAGKLTSAREEDAYKTMPFEALMQTWVPLVVVLNNLSRSMGHGDFYPFVIPVAAYPKLQLIHDAIRSNRR